MYTCAGLDTLFHVCTKQPAWFKNTIASNLHSFVDWAAPLRCHLANATAVVMLISLTWTLMILKRRSALVRAPMMSFCSSMQSPSFRHNVADSRMLFAWPHVHPILRAAPVLSRLVVSDWFSPFAHSALQMQGVQQDRYKNDHRFTWHKRGIAPMPRLDALPPCSLWSAPSSVHCAACSHDQCCCQPQ